MLSHHKTHNSAINNTGLYDKVYTAVVQFALFFCETELHTLL